MTNPKCKECGCACKKCVLSDQFVHLHVEIENLKQKLVERENYIVTMETNFLNETNKFPNGETVALRDELLIWQDKYKRLYDAHRRVQRVNQGLEDKLLKLVDVNETDKSVLTKDIATLSKKLAEANYAIKKLTEDNERYKKDVSLAIQFLQCKQSNFVAHKFDSLPQEIQQQVSIFMTNKKKPEEKRVYEPKSIKVPIPTFPPTAMVYSVPKSPQSDKNLIDNDSGCVGVGGNCGVENQQVDIVSAAIMAKVLEERQKEKICAKHCDTCVCAEKLKIIHNIVYHNIGTQTGDYNNINFICFKCNETLNLNNSIQIYRNINNNSSNNNNSNNNINCIENNDSKLCKDVPNDLNIMLDLNNQNKNLIVSSSDIPNDNNNLLNNETKFRLIDENQSILSNESDQSGKNSSLKEFKNCSIRSQSGSRNILLDNTHNITPILYTRQINKKTLNNCNSPILHETNQQQQQQQQRTIDFININKNQSISDTNRNNQQRVADWIQSNIQLNNNENIGENSSRNYAEMEENVKRFLFGESEFLKTVEIGKIKYQSYRDNNNQENNNQNSSSHTETEI